MKTASTFFVGYKATIKILTSALDRSIVKQLKSLKDSKRIDPIEHRKHTPENP